MTLPDSRDSWTRRHTQLESNFVAMSDVSLAQEKKELAKSKAIYDEKAEGLDRGMAKLEELSKAKWKELADRMDAADSAKQK